MIVVIVIVVVVKVVIVVSVMLVIAMVSELTLKRPKIHDIPSKGIKIKAALIQDLKRKIYMIIQQASDTFHNQPFKNAVGS